MLRLDPRQLLCLAVAVGAGCRREAPPPPAHESIRVAAASDLRFAFEEMGKLYERRTGHAVTFSFGSTGLLAKQIREGAPFDVFAAANVSFVDDVVQSGACAGDSKALYARGRIATFTPRSAPDAPRTLEDLAGPRFTRIAIANPDHAPYGQAARQALQRAGVWDAVAKKLVYGENVEQALQFAQTGNADAAIVALSLAAEADGRYAVVDASLHDPIDQALVVCGRGGASHDGAARAFAALVGSSEGREVMQRHGFAPPTDKPANTE